VEIQNLTHPYLRFFAFAFFLLMLCQFHTCPTTLKAAAADSQHLKKRKKKKKRGRSKFGSMHKIEVGNYKSSSGINAEYPIGTYPN